ncbi:MAG: CapA family protein [Deltaproteobacteria bacterium]|nr:CapA family protein [Deltaproteobacteria bacterium]
MLLPALLTVVAQLASPSEATVVFAGDLVPHGDVLSSLHAHGEASLVGPLAGVLARADLALANLETPSVEALPESPDASLRFNVHRDFLRGLALAGLDGLTLANNHGYDQGLSGVTETLRAVRAAGMTPIGAADASGDPLEPARFTVAGGTLCVVAATRILNFEVSPIRPGVPRLGMARSDPGLDEERAFLARVRDAARTCDAVVVSLHTGVEYTDRPEPRDRVFFRAVAQAGADVIVGHHSHTPHPVEVVRVGAREVPVFTSLGNLVSAQGSAAERAPLEPDEPFQVVRDPRTREGLLAVLRFAPVQNAPRRLRLVRWGYVPLWIQNDREAARRQGAMVTISAAAMPWNGGPRGFLRGRWAGLVRRVGDAWLYPRELLPGADTAWPEEATARSR